MTHSLAFQKLIVDEGGLIADTRERYCQLRFIRGWIVRTLARSECKVPCHHDSWRDLYWTGELGHRGTLTAILPKEALGFLEYDEGACAGQGELETARHARQDYWHGSTRH